MTVRSLLPLVACSIVVACSSSSSGTGSSGSGGTMLDPPASGQGILALLTDLNAGGATILVATHNPEIAGAMPRTVRLRDGAIESDTGSTG